MWKLLVLSCVCLLCVDGDSTAFAQNQSSCVQSQLTPDEVAMVLGTLVVAARECGVKFNDDDLHVAIARFDQDLDDYKSDSRYAPLVSVKIKKAYEFIAGMGKAKACEAMRGVLNRYIPDVIHNK